MLGRYDNNNNNNIFNCLTYLELPQAQQLYNSPLLKLALSPGDIFSKIATSFFNRVKVSVNCNMVQTNKQ